MIVSHQLNPLQAEAARHIYGPLLVLAPVGTGKTTVLAHRAANAVAAGIEPGSILCLSFTNRAAREMRERALALLGKNSSAITVRTFHAFCTHVIRHESETLGVSADFTICDEEDCKDLLVQLARAAGVNETFDDRLAGLLFNFAQRCKQAIVEGDRRSPAEIFAGVLQTSETPVPEAVAALEPRRLLQEYSAALREHGALDFADLIALVYRLFRERDDVLARWRQLFQWIQVDEVQDTNRPEYHIIAALAETHRNLAFFGDIDQTIYEWRGSVPFEILADFRSRFDPVREIALTQNYRSTRRLVQAYECFIRSYARAVTRRIDPEAGEIGKEIVVHAAATFNEEAHWIADTIKNLVQRQLVPPREIAVLTRSNALAVDLSRVFSARRVEHFVVDKLRFFRRAEIKDALAYVRALVNRLDGHSLLRVLQRPPSWVDAGTIEAIRAIPDDVGLKLTDFVDPVTFDHADPYGLLLLQLARGKVVLFDVETTGLDVARDEIVELAAVRVGPDGPVERFHTLLKPGKPLGESVKIHGITEEMLARDGRPPAEALSQFLAFVDGCTLAGHNVTYDVNILRSQLRRLGLPWPAGMYHYDTLDMTRRFFKLHRYTLGHIVTALGLPANPTHRAMDDVLATWQLLRRLLVPVLAGKKEREVQVRRHAGRFDVLKDCFSQWREILEQERPIFFLSRLLDESGMRDYWLAQPSGAGRVANLDELAFLFGVYDDPALSPHDSLLALSNIAALGNETDRHVEQEQKVFLLTVHQAKGLEFDTVFIAGATDSEFPSFRSVREGRVDEEQRLFYVAMTRARKRLFITHHRRDSRDRPAFPSRFLTSIPEHLRREV